MVMKQYLSLSAEGFIQGDILIYVTADGEEQAKNLIREILAERGYPAKIRGYERGVEVIELLPTKEAGCLVLHLFPAITYPKFSD